MVNVHPLFNVLCLLEGESAVFLKQRGLRKGRDRGTGIAWAGPQRLPPEAAWGRGLIRNVV